jgi:hypothetical protein
MHPVRFLTLLLLATGLAAVPARAVLGETASELQKRFGRPDPTLQQGLHRNVIIWAIETAQGERLIYTVTFNSKGLSISEGIKPGRRAILNEKLAQNFVDNQLAVRSDATTTHQPRPGEKYKFGGQEFTRAANEEVWVDEASDFLVVWVKGKEPLVMAVRAEMLTRK